MPPERVFPDREHPARCLCVACATRRHADSCHCYWCYQRRHFEEVAEHRERAYAREPVSSDRAARHVAELGFTRRELAAALGMSVGTAQRVSVAGGRIPRSLEELVLRLRR